MEEGYENLKQIFTQFIENLLNLNESITLEDEKQQKGVLLLFYENLNTTLRAVKVEIKFEYKL